MSVFFYRYGLFFLLGLLLVAHLPFLVSDPDVLVSHSRDAHSDEGLNTSQVRNLVNHGYLGFRECDNLIKNPLFNLLLAGPFYAFGTKLAVGRATVLFYCIAVLLLTGRDREFRKLLFVIVPVVLLYYHIFQYMQYSMAEMVSVFSVIAALYFTWKMMEAEAYRARMKRLLAALLFASMAWLFKIQFFYIAALVPMAVAWWMAARMIGRAEGRKSDWKLLAGAVAVTGLFFIAYIVLWYLPLRESYQYIMRNQASGRFAPMNDPWPVVAENYNLYLKRAEILPLLYGFYIALPLGIVLVFTSGNSFFRKTFPIALIWVLLESHKLFIHFVPARYLVSAYMAAGLLLSVVLYEFISVLARKETRRPLRNYAAYIALLFAAYVTIDNIISYRSVLQRRTFHIHAVNRYLAKYDLDHATAVGPWAPSLTWDTKIRALPVWSGFLNDKNIREKYAPALIISEPDEQDSEQAFRKDGIDLQADADSSRVQKIGKWTVGVYWMPRD